MQLMCDQSHPGNVCHLFFFPGIEIQGVVLLSELGWACILWDSHIGRSSLVGREEAEEAGDGGWEQTSQQFVRTTGGGDSGQLEEESLTQDTFMRRLWPAFVQRFWAFQWYRPNFEALKLSWRYSKMWVSCFDTQHNLGSARMGSACLSAGQYSHLVSEYLASQWNPSSSSICWIDCLPLELLRKVFLHLSMEELKVGYIQS